PAVYFFFSSRSRHTRFSRDWSSDVCSSDLSFKPFAIASAIEAGLYGPSSLIDTSPVKVGNRVLSDEESNIGTVTLTTVLARSNRSEEHTSELQSREKLVCRLLLAKKKKGTG